MRLGPNWPDPTDLAGCGWIGTSGTPSSPVAVNAGGAVAPRAAPTRPSTLSFGRALARLLRVFTCAGGIVSRVPHSATQLIIGRCY